MLKPVSAAASIRRNARTLLSSLDQRAAASGALAWAPLPSSSSPAAARAFSSTAASAAAAPALTPAAPGSGRYSSLTGAAGEKRGFASTPAAPAASTASHHPTQSHSFDVLDASPDALLTPESAVRRRAALLEMVKSQAAGHRDAFYVVDLAEVAAKHAEWRRELPRVRPFYAVKCNDDPHIVATLARLGCGFDCASKGEMAMALKLGVPASDIIFAHPAKALTHIAYAKNMGVKRMTFDNEDELRKIGREYPGAEAVLRILTDDSASVCRLGLKFGAPLDTVPRLVAVAKEIGVNVIGISYHVGSGNGDASAFGQAVRDARKAFDMAAEQGVTFRLLDIGGGYPGSELGAAPGGAGLLAADAAAASGNPYAKHPSFATMARHIRAAMDECFPEGCGVELMAEPGRYFVKSSHALAVNVVGKRRTLDEGTADAPAAGDRLNYYVNDGLYGSFNCILYDHVTCSPSLLLTDREGAAEAQADDAIVRLSAETGELMVADAVGLPHAAALAVSTLQSAAAADADSEEEEQQQLRSMSMGGSGGASASAGGSDSHGFSAAGGAGLGGSGFAGFGRAPTPAAAAAAAAGIARSVAPRAAAVAAAPVARGLSYAALPPSAGLTGVVPRAAGATHPTTLWGPTCDSMDKISDDVRLPELFPGDWLVYENMGAYTVAGACRFNGFPIATKVYMHTDGSVEVTREEREEGEL